MANETEFVISYFLSKTKNLKKPRDLAKRRIGKRIKEDIRNKIGILISLYISIIFQ